MGHISGASFLVFFDRKELRWGAAGRGVGRRAVDGETGQTVRLDLRIKIAEWNADPGGVGGERGGR